MAPCPATQEAKRGEMQALLDAQCSAASAYCHFASETGAGPPMPPEFFLGSSPKRSLPPVHRTNKSGSYLRTGRPPFQAQAHFARPTGLDIHCVPSSPVAFCSASSLLAPPPSLSGDASGVPTLPPLRTPHAVGEAAGQEPDPDPARSVQILLLFSLPLLPQLDLRPSPRSLDHLRSPRPHPQYRRRCYRRRSGAQAFFIRAFTCGSPPRSGLLFGRLRWFCNDCDALV